MLVFEALAQDLPWSPDSLRNAAIILQHTNTENEPDDGEEFRSQEMHLLTFFLFREKAQINKEVESALLGPYRYCRTIQLPIEFDVTWRENPTTKIRTIAPDTISDEERMKHGFPFPLLEIYSRSNTNPLPDTFRVSKRDEEIHQLYLADQQTRSLFKRDEMIFNRYIERVTDAQRRARLYEMIAEDVLWDAKTLQTAAQLLNNTPSKIIKKGKIHYQLQENHLLRVFPCSTSLFKRRERGGTINRG